MGIKQDKYFWLHDGKSIKNLYELAIILEKMPNDLFNYHVTDKKNDFSNWIRDVIKDKDLAAKISQIKNAKTMSDMIRQKIKPAKAVKFEQRLKEKITKKEAAKEKKVNLKILEEPKQEPIKEKKAGKISDKVKGFVFVEEPKKEITHHKNECLGESKINLGYSCPYKSYKCSSIEFLAGIIIGLIIGLFVIGAL
jgi:hypothetical protein